MSRNLTFVLAALVGIGMTAAVCCSAEPTGLTPRQRQLNLESFDYVWTTIHDKHFDTTFGGLDWDAVKTELRPKMEQAAGMEEARNILLDMLDRLGLSHFDIIPGELYDDIDGPAKRVDDNGVTGMDARVVDNRAMVIAVVSGSPAEAAGVRPGWEIIAVDGYDIGPHVKPIAKKFAGRLNCELLLAYTVQGRLRGAVGDTVQVRFLDGKNQTVEKSLPLVEHSGKKVSLGNLPSTYLTIVTDTLADNIGYFAFNYFLDPPAVITAFSDAVKSFADSPGLIIDLRGNLGGIGGIAIGLAGFLVAEKNLYLGTLSTRDTKLNLIINPRLPRYDGPVAVLVDGMSASGSEFFAGGLQDIGRARVFGRRTLGAALPSTIEQLPNGDGFQYVFGNYVSRSGAVLEGRGVIPDEEIVLSRETLQAGNDPVIEAAMQWIRRQNEGHK